VDLSLHNLRTKRCKHLIEVALSIQPGITEELLKDVNKPSASPGRCCVSPIHRYSDSNL